MKIIAFLKNPFEKIAGGRALGLGLACILFASAVCWRTGYLFDGLLHITYTGPVPWPLNLLLQLTVWLMPATLFFLAGLMLSPSKIRAVDVYGTVALAQCPLWVSVLCTRVGLGAPPPALPKLAHLPPLSVACLLLGVLFLGFAVFRMFQALKVACNLRGVKLWVAFLSGIIGGDLLVRILVPPLFYFGCSVLMPNAEAAQPAPIASAAATAEAPADNLRISGVYEGVIPIPGQPLRLRLIVRDKGGLYQAAFSSPDQSPTEFALPNFTHSGQQVAFAFPALNLSYAGALDAQGVCITGTFSQNGMRFPLELARRPEGAPEQ